MSADLELDDSTLVGLAREGDRQAFARLVERHYDFVYRVALRWAGRKADAEDIAQDVCARLGRAIRGFRGEGGLRTWLYTLTLNAARDHGRKTARETAKISRYQLEPVEANDLADEARAEALWSAVRTLPDKQREAVVLVYGEGLGHAAAADLMACAEATVSWHVHEAKKRLKLLMRNAGEV